MTSPGRYIFSSRFISLMIVRQRDLESDSSYIVKSAVYPSISASTLSMCEKIEWKVPILRYLTSSSPTRCEIRSFISRAALLVNVRAIICQGFSPACAMRYAILYVRTRVLPDPAPAITSDGPSIYSTAAFWLSFSPLNIFHLSKDKSLSLVHIR